MLCLRSDLYRVGRGPLGEYGGWLQYIEYPVIKLKMIIIEYNTHSGTTNRVVPLSGPLALLGLGLPPEVLVFGLSTTVRLSGLPTKVELVVLDGLRDLLDSDLQCVVDIGDRVKK